MKLFQNRNVSAVSKGKGINVDWEPSPEQSLNVIGLKQQTHHGLFPGARADDGLVEGKEKVTGRESGEGD